MAESSLPTSPLTSSHSPASEPQSETAATDALNGQYENAEIPLALIDPPLNPERETMEEQDLADLAISIRRVGLIKPLVVERVSDRYRVVAGHRRYLACTLVQYSPVPCRVKVGDAVNSLEILVEENAHTEAVNPIEEARFYLRVLNELCEGDVDRLVTTVGRNQNFLEDRLNLLNGHQVVIDALQGKKISLAVARELNRERDPGRLTVFLDAAVNQGATARQVAQWRRDGELQGAIPLLADFPTDQPTNPAAVPYSPFMLCMFCGTAEFPSMMELVWLHKPCKGIVRRALNLPEDTKPPQG